MDPQHSHSGTARKLSLGMLCSHWQPLQPGLRCMQRCMLHHCRTCKVSIKRTCRCGYPVAELTRGDGWPLQVP